MCLKPSPHIFSGFGFGILVQKLRGGSFDQKLKYIEYSVLPWTGIEEVFTILRYIIALKISRSDKTKRDKVFLVPDLHRQGSCL